MPRQIEGQESQGGILQQKRDSLIRVQGDGSGSKKSSIDYLENERNFNKNVPPANPSYTPKFINPQLITRTQKTIVPPDALSQKQDPLSYFEEKGRKNSVIDEQRGSPYSSLWDKGSQLRQNGGQETPGFALRPTN